MHITHCVLIYVVHCVEGGLTQLSLYQLSMLSTFCQPSDIGLSLDSAFLYKKPINKTTARICHDLSFITIKDIHNTCGNLYCLKYL